MVMLLWSIHINMYIWVQFSPTMEGLIVTLRDKRKHYFKFVSFLNKNRDCPFFIKKKVLDSALISTILYNCESWIGTVTDLKPPHLY